MVRKLISVSKKIHWSSAVKAAAFGASWFFLPYWVPVIVGLYFYFIPTFRALGMAAPFIIIIFLMLTTGKSVLFAVFLSFVFYLTLALKDMHFVNKEHPRDMLVFSLLLPLFIKFFSFFNGWVGIAPVLFSLLVALATFFLLKSPVSKQLSTKIMGIGAITATIATFLVWQLALILLFLPLNFIYQSAALLVFTVIVFALMTDYSAGFTSKRRILVNVSAFLVFSAVILGSAQWGL